MATLNQLFSNMPSPSGKESDSIQTPPKGQDEDAYWKFQEELNQESLKKNPRYIQWKQRQAGGRENDSTAIEPTPMG